MPFFSEDNVERVRAASDIVEIIGGYLPLKRAGANFIALCPFHREKTPSFNVNPHKQIFYCFGCHKGGDVFSFVKEFEAIDFPEAVRRLAERARIPLEYERSPGEQQARFLKEKLLRVHEQICQHWQAVLLNQAAGQAARDYLARRAVPEEAIRLFRLGCAPEAWDDTVNWAAGKGHDRELLERAGLIVKRDSAEGYYDRFRGRLMFPICDEQGRVIGFSGRLLNPEATAAKYVNSPETPIFSKSKVFFGLDKSRRALLEAGRAIVCEGQLDLIACHLAGVTNVVAPQGTAFTAEHAAIIKRYVEEVVLCFDADAAGQDAARRSFDHLLESGVAVRVAVLPAPHDPDSFIRSEGAEKFRALLDKAEGFFDYLLKRLCQTHDTSGDRGRMAVVNGMAEAALKTGNRVLIDKYAQATALRLGVSPESVRAEFTRFARTMKPGGGAFAPASEAQPPAAPPPNPQEHWLLKLLIVHEEYVPWAAEHLRLEWLQHPAVSRLLDARYAAHSEGTWTNLASFLGDLDNPEERQLLAEAAAGERAIPHPARQLLELAARLRNACLDRQIAAVRHEASQPETPDERKLELLRLQQQLREAKKAPLPSPEE